jgi:hypothetical protein
VLSFVLGIVAVIVKSDLRIPEQVYSIISIYLLFAIGLKGGFDLARTPSSSFLPAALMAILLGLGIVGLSFLVLRRFSNFDDANVVSIALHYGAVSAATLSAAITFLNEAEVGFEGFMPTMYVIMEIPAVILALVLASWRLGERKQNLRSVVTSALTGKGFLLLGGGVLIGYISGEPGYQQVKVFFVDLFPGFLALFLLEMGTRVGQRLPELRKMGAVLLAFGLLMPLIHGTAGVFLGSIAGLSVGGAMLMGVLAGSASYITAPTIVETNIPQADVGRALTSSLVITFPLNITLGLPLYFELAQLLAG